jgi:hypothetical protein
MNDTIPDIYTAQSTLKVGESSFDYEPGPRHTDKGTYIGFLCIASELMDTDGEPPQDPPLRMGTIVVIRTTTWVEMSAAFRSYGHHAPPFSSIGYRFR